MVCNLSSEQNKRSRKVKTKRIHINNVLYLEPFIEEKMPEKMNHPYFLKEATYQTTFLN